MSPAGRVTLSTIAQAAGTTAMTVSMALRNHPRISEATRLKIQKLARTLGYRPDPVLSRLMTHLRNSRKTMQLPTVAYLTSRGSGTDWRRSYLGRMFAGAQQRAAALGFNLEVMALREKGMSAQRMNGILKARGIEGVLIAPLVTGGGHLNLDLDQFAVAHVGGSLWRPALHRAHHDYSHGTMLMLRKMVRHGYRRIGMVTNLSLARTTGHEEEAAFLYYAARLKMEPLAPLVLTDWNEAVFLDWFRKNRPDAVATCYPETVTVLSGAGFPVPETTGVALNWIPDGSPCSGVWQDFEGVGAAAFDLVESQFRRHEHGIPDQPKTVLVRGRWVDGNTLRNLTDSR